MKRNDLIQKRDKCWTNVEFLKDLQGKIKNKDKSIYYMGLMKKEKFKYKMYNVLLKQVQK